MSTNWEVWVLVALGSGLGAVCRYVVSGWVARLGSTLHPWGTFTVNVLGCIVLGLIAGSYTSAMPLDSPLFLFVVAGLLGGFTTVSSFLWQVLTLLRNRQYRVACRHLFLTFGAGMAGMISGWYIASLISQQL